MSKGFANLQLKSIMLGMGAVWWTQQSEGLQPEWAGMRANGLKTFLAIMQSFPLEILFIRASASTVRVDGGAMLFCHLEKVCVSFLEKSGPPAPVKLHLDFEASYYRERYPF